jgi:hypothetical protein
MIQKYFLPNVSNKVAGKYGIFARNKNYGFFDGKAASIFPTIKA